MSHSKIKRSSSQQTGFTLVELVLVIIVLGVLAATAAPKLISKSAFEDYTVRDQLISRLRLVQLQGMNADPTDDAAENACYWLVTKSSCFYHQQTSRTGSTCETPSTTIDCNDEGYNQYNSVSFTDVTLSSAHYRFDINGKLTSDSATSPITINGENNLAIEIESEGYIHASTQ